VNQASSVAVSTAHCSVDHANCYCTRGDFVNQVKTCITQHCTSAADQSTVNAFANGYCAGKWNLLSCLSSHRLMAPTDATAASTVSGGPSSSLSSSSYAYPSTETGTKYSTATSNAPAAATSAPSDQLQQKSSGLSTGAKAGIGAGIPLGLLAIVLAFFLAWRCKPKNNTSSQLGRENRYEVERPAIGTGSEEYAAKELYVPPPVIHELPTGNRAQQGFHVRGIPYSPSEMTEQGTSSPS
jgi:hypothetical protein